MFRRQKNDTKELVLIILTVVLEEQFKNINIDIYVIVV